MILPLPFVTWGLAAATTVQVLVQDKHGNPVPDAVVYLAGDEAGPDAPRKPWVMDQVDRELLPHVLPVPVGSAVAFPNKDDIHHQLYSFSEAKRFELPLYKGKPAEPVLFDKAGVVKLGCSIHDWMSGVILVLPTSRFAKTDKRGAAHLELPEGTEVELEVYHERLRGEPAETRQKVALAGSPKVTWKVSLKADRQKKKPVTFSNY